MVYTWKLFKTKVKGGGGCLFVFTLVKVSLGYIGYMALQVKAFQGYVRTYPSSIGDMEGGGEVAQFSFVSFCEYKTLDKYGNARKWGHA